MSGHTPGPWEYYPARNYKGFEIAPKETGPSLARCMAFGVNMTIECYNFPGDAEANARLIAAAPELLEACKALVDYIEDDNPGGAACDAWLVGLLGKARAAIAKATNGEG